MISKAGQERQIHGCRISKLAPSISHILFVDDGFFFLFFKATEMECSTMKDILGFYGAVSGQVINFSKPGVFFSANVPFHQKAALSQLLGVSSPLNTGKYLGLPSLIGRNKRSLFHHIKERLWKRIQSWNGKFLSITGREVLEI